VNGSKILVVDDHADNRDVYALVLEHSGYQVMTASNGREAVEIARSRLPDLVLMDISMPVLDGLQATELLKGDAATRHIPVLVITAHDDPRMVRRSAAAGVAGYLLKPAPPAVVVAEIERCLAEAAGEMPAVDPFARAGAQALGVAPLPAPASADSPADPDALPPSK
jgi:two-component system, cell cycle response regulator DivK